MRDTNQLTMLGTLENVELKEIETGRNAFSVLNFRISCPQGKFFGSVSVGSEKNGKRVEGIINDVLKEDKNTLFFFNGSLKSYEKNGELKITLECKSDGLIPVIEPKDFDKPLPPLVVLSGMLGDLSSADESIIELHVEYQAKGNGDKWETKYRTIPVRFENMPSTKVKAVTIIGTLVNEKLGKNYMRFVDASIWYEVY